MTRALPLRVMCRFLELGVPVLGRQGTEHMARASQAVVGHALRTAASASSEPGFPSAPTGFGQCIRVWSALQATRVVVCTVGGNPQTTVKSSVQDGGAVAVAFGSSRRSAIDFCRRAHTAATLPRLSLLSFHSYCSPTCISGNPRITAAGTHRRKPFVALAPPLFNPACCLHRLATLLV